MGVGAGVSVGVSVGVGVDIDVGAAGSVGVVDRASVGTGLFGEAPVVGDGMAVAINSAGVGATTEVATGVGFGLPHAESTKKKTAMVTRRQPIFFGIGTPKCMPSFLR